MIRVVVRLFAGAKERLGMDSIAVTIELPASVSRLKTAITELHPTLEPFVRYGRIAKGNDFIDDEALIQPDDQSDSFALIPPVSGG
jgi:molybdopterin converting factor small subunit